MAEHVLVVIAQPDGDGIGGSGGEAIGAGRALASKLGLPLACAVIGSGVGGAATEAAERGADRVLVADAPHLAHGGEGTVQAAVEAAKAAEATNVLIARGPDDLELAPRLAVRLGGGSVRGATEIRVEGNDVQVVSAVFGGAARAVFKFGPGARVIGLNAAVAEAPARQAGRTAEVTKLDVAAPASERVKVVQAATASTGPRLQDAHVVVSGGRGLQDGKNYALIRELAAKLGGMPGASRAIVDDGWAQPTEQVGLTGTIVAPEIYFAIGISGASQHLAGCSNSRVLVAVNSDRDAPIFKYAHFGIVDDCLAVLPELIRKSGEVTVAKG